MGIQKSLMHWHSWQNRTSASQGVQVKFAPVTGDLVSPGIRRSGKALSLARSKGKARYKDPERNTDQLAQRQSSMNNRAPTSALCRGFLWVTLGSHLSCASLRTKLGLFPESVPCPRQIISCKSIWWIIHTSSCGLSSNNDPVLLWSSWISELKAVLSTPYSRMVLSEWEKKSNGKFPKKCSFSMRVSAVQRTASHTHTHTLSHCDILFSNYDNIFGSFSWSIPSVLIHPHASGQQGLWVVFSSVMISVTLNLHELFSAYFEF